MSEITDLLQDIRDLRQRVSSLELRRQVIGNAITVLPSNPVPGDHVYFLADGANGLVWHLLYLPDGSAYPWKYVGGPPRRGSGRLTHSRTRSGRRYPASAASSADNGVQIKRSGRPH